MRKLLFTRESPCLQPLRELIERQNHRALVMWAIDCGEHVLPIFERKFPHDARPREAVDAAKAWARGKIKMPAAKKAAHAAHNAATAVADENPAACAAARATGHVVGTVHVETHAIGVAMYGLTAFAYSTGKKDADAVVAKECNWMYKRLLYWEANIIKAGKTWAPFLLRGDVPNKEALLRKKKGLKRVQEKGARGCREFCPAPHGKSPSETIKNSKRLLFAMDRKEDFFKIYANLPLDLRKEIILIIDKAPITWNVAFQEIDKGTKLGGKILKKLAELEMV